MRLPAAHFEAPRARAPARDCGPFGLIVPDPRFELERDVGPLPRFDETAPTDREGIAGAFLVARESGDDLRPFEGIDGRERSKRI
jgi:hypothetical protein